MGMAQGVVLVVVLVWARALVDWVSVWALGGWEQRVELGWASALEEEA